MFEVEYEDILQRMLDRVPDSIDKRQGSIIYDALAPAAAELVQAYIYLDFVASKLNVENLEGEELETYIYQRAGIERKQATKAIRKGIFSRADGSFFNVDIGSRFTGGDLYFTVIEKIADGEFKLECEEPGEAGNEYVGALIPVDYIDGLANAQLTDILIPGYNAESDSSLLTRYYEKIRTPPINGNKHHYIQWAKEITGVGDARVVPLWNGPGTVKVVIIDSNKQPASNDLVQAVKEHIEEERPIGANVTVVSAVAKTIDISLTIVKDDAFTLEQVKENITNNIRKYFEEVAFKQELISYARIGKAVLETEGVLDYSELVINGVRENIMLDYEETPVLGEVMVSE